MTEQKPKFLTEIKDLNRVTEILFNEYEESSVHGNVSSWCDVLFEKLTPDDKERLITLFESLSFCDIDLPRDKIENVIAICIGISDNYVDDGIGKGFTVAVVDDYERIDCDILNELSLDEFMNCVKELDTSIKLFG